MICHTFDLIEFMAHNVTCLRVIYEGEIRVEQMLGADCRLRNCHKMMCEKLR